MHRVVKFLLDEVERQGISHRSLAYKNSRAAYHNLFYMKTAPRLDILEHHLSKLGYEIRIVPKGTRKYKNEVPLA